MGLDGVEIVMEVEEAFDIVIADSDAEKCMTPFDLIELVMSKVGRTDRAGCLSQRSFHFLRRAFVNEVGIARSDFSLDVPLKRFLSKPDRKRKLQAIGKSVGADLVSELVLPRWIGTMILCTGIFTGIAVWLYTRSLPSPLLQSLSLVWGIIASVAALKLGFVVTRPLRDDFPDKLATVGKTTRWLVGHNPSLFSDLPGEWSRKQVAERVREIVIEMLCCEKTYREDARFVEDLGLS
ncbi:MAG: hypothetical protein ABIR24_08395 [Verrucomicrobiota bacterium]